jgi:GT2 family glycosyltransferase
MQKDSVLKIAVLMTCYNRVNNTLKCLECFSLAEVPKNTEFHIYLVDDKSSDNTGKIIKEKYSNINVIYGTGSLFWNRGMRLAWSKARKDYDYDFYLWLNDDTYIRYNALTIIINDYQDLFNKGIEALIAGVCQDTDSGNITYGGLDSNYKIIIPDGTSQSCKYINGNITLISKNIFKKLHYLLYRFKHSAGDHDYGLRAINKGFSCYTSSLIIAECKDEKLNVQYNDWKNPDEPLKRRFNSLFSVKENNTRDNLFLVYRVSGIIPAFKIFISSLKNVLFPKYRTEIKHNNNFSIPILFLIFNRLETTIRVFERIRSIKPSKLYIASDGPRIDRLGEADKVKSVRKHVLNSIDWPCEIKTLFREDNLGCGKSVSQSITWFFDNEEMGIILEDDCLPSLSFFSYCEILLNKYKNNPRILHISGYNPLTYIKSNYSYYFARIHHCWGWASWKRAWDKYNYNIQNLNIFFKKRKLDIIFNRYIDKRYWSNIFKKMEKHEVDTWDYQWVYSIFENNGLCINPCNNLVTNIGYGVDATHTLADDYFHNTQKQYELTEIIHPKKINININILNKINDTFIGYNFSYFFILVKYTKKSLKNIINIIIKLIKNIFKITKIFIKILLGLK